jgi:hypothetical protein
MLGAFTSVMDGTIWQIRAINETDAPVNHFELTLGGTGVVNLWQASHDQAAQRKWTEGRRHGEGWHTLKCPSSPP